MNQQPAFDAAQFNRTVGEAFRKMHDVVSRMQERVRTGMNTPALREAGSQYRYNREVEYQRRRGRAFVIEEARRVRAELRARGLDIPER